MTRAILAYQNLDFSLPKPYRVYMKDGVVLNPLIEDIITQNISELTTAYIRDNKGKRNLNPQFQD